MVNARNGSAPMDRRAGGVSADNVTHFFPAPKSGALRRSRRSRSRSKMVNSLRSSVRAAVVSQRSLIDLGLIAPTRGRLVVGGGRDGRPYRRRVHAGA
jgi:hypothetical protein